jgi:hypothetical protein
MRVSVILLHPLPLPTLPDRGAGGQEGILGSPCGLQGTKARRGWGNIARSAPKTRNGLGVELRSFSRIFVPSCLGGRSPTPKITEGATRKIARDVKAVHVDFMLGMAA